MKFRQVKKLISHIDRDTFNFIAKHGLDLKQRYITAFRCARRIQRRFDRLPWKRCWRRFVFSLQVARMEHATGRTLSDQQLREMTNENWVAEPDPRWPMPL